jgi:hypothetical protein
MTGHPTLTSGLDAGDSVSLAVDYDALVRAVTGMPSEIPKADS